MCHSTLLYIYTCLVRQDFYPFYLKERKEQLLKRGEIERRNIKKKEELKKKGKKGRRERERERKKERKTEDKKRKKIKGSILRKMQAVTNFNQSTRNQERPFCIKKVTTPSNWDQISAFCCLASRSIPI